MTFVHNVPISSNSCTREVSNVLFGFDCSMYEEKCKLECSQFGTSEKWLAPQANMKLAYGRKTLGFMWGSTDESKTMLCKCMHMGEYTIICIALFHFRLWSSGQILLFATIALCHNRVWTSTPRTLQRCPFSFNFIFQHLKWEPTNNFNRKHWLHVQGTKCKNVWWKTFLISDCTNFQRQNTYFVSLGYPERLASWRGHWIPGL
jgi:hypothetical protein